MITLIENLFETYIAHPNDNIDEIFTPYNYSESDYELLFELTKILLTSEGVMSTKIKIEPIMNETKTKRLIELSLSILETHKKFIQNIPFIKNHLLFFSLLNEYDGVFDMMFNWHKEIEIDIDIVNNRVIEICNNSTLDTVNDRRTLMLERWIKINPSFVRYVINEPKYHSLLPQPLKKAFLIK